MTGPVATHSAAYSALYRAALLTATLLALFAHVGAAGEPGPGRARRSRLARPGRTNVIDDSLFSLAEFYLNEGRTADGVAVLERVAGETPDGDTRSMAHFNLATIHETTLDDPDRARAEYARVTGPWAAAARGRVLGPLRAGKRWAEATDFLGECLAACEEPSEKAQVVRMLTAIAKASGDDKLLEATLRSVPDLITYEEAKAAAEADREKLDEMRKRAEAARTPGHAGPGAGRRPALRHDAPRHDAPRQDAPRRVRKPAVRDGAAPARPIRSAAEIEVQIRELERAGFNDEARRLRQELRKLKEGEDPEQF